MPAVLVGEGRALISASTHLHPLSCQITDLRSLMSAWFCRRKCIYIIAVSFDAVGSFLLRVLSEMSLFYTFW